MKIFRTRGLVAGIVSLAALIAPAMSAQASTTAPDTPSSTAEITSPFAKTAARKKAPVNPLTGVSPVPGPNPTNRLSQPYSLFALPNNGTGRSAGSGFTPEKPPAGQPAVAPDRQIVGGISFIDDPNASIPQQNPDYSASTAQPIFDSKENVTGISINGKKQNYTTQIPY